MVDITMDTRANNYDKLGEKTGRIDPRKLEARDKAIDAYQKKSRQRYERKQEESKMDKESRDFFSEKNWEQNYRKNSTK